MKVCALYIWNAEFINRHRRNKRVHVGRTPLFRVIRINRAGAMRCLCFKQILIYDGMDLFTIETDTGCTEGIGEFHYVHTLLYYYYYYLVNF